MMTEPIDELDSIKLNYDQNVFRLNCFRSVYQSPDVNSPGKWKELIWIGVFRPVFEL